MATAKKFWLHTIGWAFVLTTAFTVLSLVGGGGTAALGSLPGWAALGLALGTYPAGVAVSHLVVGEPGLNVRALVHMIGTSLSVSVLLLVLLGFVGPAFQRSSDNPGIYESRRLSLVELRAAIGEAIDTADPNGTLEQTTIREWLPVNQLTWELFVRLSGVVLPFLFAWIGLAAGYWTGLTPNPQLRLPQLLGLGLLLVVSTYLANENSFEWIVVQAAGPVPFAGLFSLIVPSLLMVGMCWPLGLMKWHQGLRE